MTLMGAAKRVGEVMVFILVFTAGCYVAKQIGIVTTIVITASICLLITWATLFFILRAIKEINEGYRSLRKVLESTLPLVVRGANLPPEEAERIRELIREWF